jgi:hypothetical protein
MEKELSEFKIKELIKINVAFLERLKKGDTTLLDDPSGTEFTNNSFQAIAALFICEIVKKTVVNNYDAIGIIEAAKLIYFDNYMAKLK